MVPSSVRLSIFEPRRESSIIDFAEVSNKSLFAAITAAHNVFTTQSNHWGGGGSASSCIRERAVALKAGPLHAAKYTLQDTFSRGRRHFYGPFLYFRADQYDKSCPGFFPCFFTTQLHMHSNERGERAHKGLSHLCVHEWKQKVAALQKNLISCGAHGTRMMLFDVSREVELEEKGAFLYFFANQVDHFARNRQKSWHGGVFFSCYSPGLNGAQCESAPHYAWQRSEKPDYWPQLPERRGFPRVFRPAPFATFWALKLPFVCHYAFVTP